MIIALDLETTWLDPTDDKIIEFALIKFDPENYEIIEEFSALIDPGIHIPEICSSITKIYDSDVKWAAKWEDIQEKVSDFIADFPVLWHNVAFDISFLRSNNVELSNNLVLDTFFFANFLVLGEKSLSLEYLSKHFKLKLEWAHRALNDTRATIFLFQKLMSEISLLSDTKKDIAKKVFDKAWDEAWLFVLNELIKYKAVNLSEEAYEEALQRLFPKKPKYPKIHSKEPEQEDFSKLLQNISWLEQRDSQKRMSEIVTETFKKQKFSIIEAPTGIWKTYAYLIPWIVHSLKTGEQIYISTSTKALQDQIFNKDLKGLEKKSGLKFSYSKLKGKRNYLWIWNFVKFLQSEKNYTSALTAFELKIIFWLSLTQNWELDELDYYGQEFSYLSEINADNALTLSKENPYAESEFLINARNIAKKSNIVILNNSLLFQWISSDNQLLWKLENLVLDEAHNLEDVLTQSLQKRFCISDLEATFTKLEKKLKEWWEKSSNFELKKQLILLELDYSFDLLSNYLMNHVPAQSKYQICLLKNSFHEWEGKKFIEDGGATKILLLFQEYLDAFQAFGDKFIAHISRELNYIEEVYDIFSKFFLEYKSGEYILSLNKNEHRGLYLEYTYLHPWKYLRDILWTKLSSCVITSATMKTHDSFDYIRDMLSLDTFDFYEIETEFDYEKQALLFVPDDLWNIKTNFPSLLRFITDFMKVVKGRTMVLFTSFDSIRQLVSQTSKELDESNIKLYAQSISWGKQKMIDFYIQNSESSLLVGTNTLWEWVDIAGEDLRYLIIHKIPFMVPSDPVFQARSMLFKDPFQDYAIPKSIIKLKQWFGRLIRTKNDSGIVIFLDDRIFSSKWWEAIYSAFPPDIKKKQGSSSSFLSILKDSTQKDKL